MTDLTLLASEARSVCLHEAAHAASLILAGMPPLMVRVDSPRRGLAGHVLLDWEHHEVNPATIRQAILAAMAGPAMTSELVEHDWPLDPEAWGESSGDAKQISLLCAHLDVGGLGWLRLVFECRKQAADPRFRRLTVAIADELERLELLTQPELLAVAETI